MKDILDSERPKGRADVVFRPLDDTWVLFDPRTERLHVLNLTAALIWEHMDGETTLNGLADAVGSAFDPRVAATEILPDVKAVLDRFEESGLLESPQAG